MFCKKAWTKDYLYTVLPKTYINTTLKSLRENVLLDREKSRMPATQPQVEAFIQRRKQQKLINELLDQRRKLAQDMRNLNQSIEIAYRNMDHLRHNAASEATGVIKCDRKCPIENCKGFLNCKNFTCGICESKICKHCNEILTDDHTCNPDDVATVELINKDTKPCPSCGELIFKVSGCDQMYCTSCNTAFSWRRGVIERGAIHNPHYFEWLQQGGGHIERNIHDQECGGLPHRYTFVELDRQLGLNFNLLPVYRFVIHIQHVEFYRYETRNDDNSDLRILYMLNELNEDAFKKQIQQREKARYKKQEYAQIFRMLHDTITEYLRQIDEMAKPFYTTGRTLSIPSDAVEKIQDLAKNFAKLRTFANTQFGTTARSLNVRPIEITRRWEVA
jgi:hypothetical protein